MTITPKRILIADDEGDARESTVAILADAGYACNAARDTTEASGSSKNDTICSDRCPMPGTCN